MRFGVGGVTHVQPRVLSSSGVGCPVNSFSVSAVPVEAIRLSAVGVAGPEHAATATALAQAKPANPYLEVLYTLAQRVRSMVSPCN